MQLFNQTRVFFAFRKSFSACFVNIHLFTRSCTHITPMLSLSLSLSRSASPRPRLRWCFVRAVDLNPEPLKVLLECEQGPCLTRCWIASGGSAHMSRTTPILFLLVAVQLERVQVRHIGPVHSSIDSASPTNPGLDPWVRGCATDTNRNIKKTCAKRPRNTRSPSVPRATSSVQATAPADPLPANFEQYGRLRLSKLCRSCAGIAHVMAAPVLLGRRPAGLPVGMAGKAVKGKIARHVDLHPMPSSGSGPVPHHAATSRVRRVTKAATSCSCSSSGSSCSSGSSSSWPVTA